MASSIFNHCEAVSSGVPVHEKENGSSNVNSCLEHGSNSSEYHISGLSSTKDPSDNTTSVSKSSCLSNPKQSEDSNLQKISDQVKPSAMISKLDVSSPSTSQNSTLVNEESFKNTKNSSYSAFNVIPEKNIDSTNNCGKLDISHGSPNNGISSSETGINETNVEQSCYSSFEENPNVETINFKRKVFTTSQQQLSKHDSENDHCKCKDISFKKADFFWNFKDKASVQMSVPIKIENDRFSVEVNLPAESGNKENDNLAETGGPKYSVIVDYSLNKVTSEFNCHCYFCSRFGARNFVKRNDCRSRNSITERNGNLVNNEEIDRCICLLHGAAVEEVSQCKLQCPVLPPVVCPNHFSNADISNIISALQNMSLVAKTCNYINKPGSSVQNNANISFISLSQKPVFSNPLCDESSANSRVVDTYKYSVTNKQNQNYYLGYRPFQIGGKGVGIESTKKFLKSKLSCSSQDTPENLKGINIFHTTSKQKDGKKYSFFETLGHKSNNSFVKSSNPNSDAIESDIKKSHSGTKELSKCCASLSQPSVTLNGNNVASHNINLQPLQCNTSHSARILVRSGISNSFVDEPLILPAISKSPYIETETSPVTSENQHVNLNVSSTENSSCESIKTLIHKNNDLSSSIFRGNLNLHFTQVDTSYLPHRKMNSSNYLNSETDYIQSSLNKDASGNNTTDTVEGIKNKNTDRKDKTGSVQHSSYSEEVVEPLNFIEKYNDSTTCTNNKIFTNVLNKYNTETNLCKQLNLKTANIQKDSYETDLNKIYVNDNPPVIINSKPGKDEMGALIQKPSTDFPVQKIEESLSTPFSVLSNFNSDNNNILLQAGNDKMVDNNKQSTPNFMEIDKNNSTNLNNTQEKSKLLNGLPDDNILQTKVKNITTRNEVDETQLKSYSNSHEIKYSNEKDKYMDLQNTHVSNDSRSQFVNKTPINIETNISTKGNINKSSKKNDNSLEINCREKHQNPSKDTSFLESLVEDQNKQNIKVVSEAQHHNDKMRNKVITPSDFDITPNVEVSDGVHDITKSESFTEIANFNQCDIIPIIKNYPDSKNHLTDYEQSSVFPSIVNSKTEDSDTNCLQTTSKRTVIPSFKKSESELYKFNRKKKNLSPSKSSLTEDTNVKMINQINTNDLPSSSKYICRASDQILNSSYETKPALNCMKTNVINVQSTESDIHFFSRCHNSSKYSDIIGQESEKKSITSFNQIKNKETSLQCEEAYKKDSSVLEIEKNINAADDKNFSDHNLIYNEDSKLSSEESSERCFVDQYISPQKKRRISHFTAKYENQPTAPKEIHMLSNLHDLSKESKSTEKEIFNDVSYGDHPAPLDLFKTGENNEKSLKGEFKVPEKMLLKTRSKVKRKNRKKLQENEDALIEHMCKSWSYNLLSPLPEIPDENVEKRVSQITQDFSCQSIESTDSNHISFEYNNSLREELKMSENDALKEAESDHSSADEQNQSKPPIDNSRFPFKKQIKTDESNHYNLHNHEETPVLSAEINNKKSFDDVLDNLHRTVSFCNNAAEDTDLSFYKCFDKSISTADSAKKSEQINNSSNSNPLVLSSEEQSSTNYNKINLLECSDKLFLDVQTLDEQRNSTISNMKHELLLKYEKKSFSDLSSNLPEKHEYLTTEPTKSDIKQNFTPDCKDTSKKKFSNNSVKAGCNRAFVISTQSTQTGSKERKEVHSCEEINGTSECVVLLKASSIQTESKKETQATLENEQSNKSSFSISLEFNQDIKFLSNGISDNYPSKSIVPLANSHPDPTDKEDSNKSGDSVSTVSLNVVSKKSNMVGLENHLSNELSTNSNTCKTVNPNITEHVSVGKHDFFQNLNNDISENIKKAHSFRDHECEVTGVMNSKESLRTYSKREKKITQSSVDLKKYDSKMSYANETSFSSNFPNNKIDVNNLCTSSEESVLTVNPENSKNHDDEPISSKKRRISHVMAQQKAYLFSSLQLKKTGDDIKEIEAIKNKKCDGPPSFNKAMPGMNIPLKSELHFRRECSRNRLLKVKAESRKDSETLEQKSHSNLNKKNKSLNEPTDFCRSAVQNDLVNTNMAVNEHKVPDHVNSDLSSKILIKIDKSSLKHLLSTHKLPFEPPTLKENDCSDLFKCNSEPSAVYVSKENFHSTKVLEVSPNKTSTNVQKSTVHIIKANLSNITEKPSSVPNNSEKLITKEDSVSPSLLDNSGNQCNGLVNRDMIERISVEPSNIKTIKNKSIWDTDDDSNDSGPHCFRERDARTVKQYLAKRKNADIKINNETTDVKRVETIINKNNGTQTDPLRITVIKGETQSPDSFNSDPNRLCSQFVVESNHHGNRDQAYAKPIEGACNFLSTKEKATSSLQNNIHKINEDNKIVLNTIDSSGSGTCVTENKHFLQEFKNTQSLVFKGFYVDRLETTPILSESKLNSGGSISKELVCEKSEEVKMRLRDSQEVSLVTKNNLSEAPARDISENLNSRKRKNFDYQNPTKSVSKRSKSNENCNLHSYSEEESIIECKENVFICALKYYSKIALSKGFAKEDDHEVDQHYISEIKRQITRMFGVDEDNLYKHLMEVVEPLRSSPIMKPKPFTKAIIQLLSEEKKQTFNNVQQLSRVSKICLLFTLLYVGNNTDFLFAVLSTLEEHLCAFHDKTLSMQEGVKIVRYYAALCTSYNLDSKGKQLIFDILYARPYMAYSMIYTLLKIWPNVLPTKLKCFEEGCLLSQTVAFILLFMGTDNLTKGPILTELHIYLSNEYGYVKGFREQDDLIDEIICRISEQDSKLALVLLAKFEGYEWAKATVEKKLFPPLQAWTQGKLDRLTAEELILTIGMIVRAFPLNKSSIFVRTTINLFEEILHHSPDEKFAETVIESIILLRRHNLMLCALVLLKWIPKSGTVTKKTLLNIKSILSVRNIQHWISFYTKNHNFTN